MTLSATERQRRSRAHRRGDHSLCDLARCDGQVKALVTRRPVTPEPPVTPVTITFGARGRRLWADLTATEPGPAERVLIEEACRLVDRLDRLDRLLAGEGAEWLRWQVNDGSEVTVVVDKALAEARQQQIALKTVLAELRATRAPVRGRRPGPVETPQGKGGGVADLTARLAARRTAGQ